MKVGVALQGRGRRATIATTNTIQVQTSLAASPEANMTTGYEARTVDETVIAFTFVIFVFLEVRRRNERACVLTCCSQILYSFIKTDTHC